MKVAERENLVRQLRILEDSKRHQVVVETHAVTKCDATQNASGLLTSKLETVHNNDDDYYTGCVLIRLRFPLRYCNSRNCINYIIKLEIHHKHQKNETPNTPNIAGYRTKYTANHYNRLDL